MRADFAAFYEAVHDRRPFPWQERLVEQVLTDGWPATIGVPTGCGKTSVIDVAVFALAAQAGLPAAARTAPLRIFFVVDRRLVVDDVSRHAQELAGRIEEGEAEPLVWVRQQLGHFGSRRPLETAVLRGGMYRSDSWADAPNQPLVCVSTVDQVGSRLLFRGYGVSDCQRPVHAGLIGNDSLIIVDEAHLSRPFLDTLEWVRRYQGDRWRDEPVRRYQGDRWRDEQVAQALRLVRMSATIEGAESGFQLDAQDLESEGLKPRLNAEKIAELKEVSNLCEAAGEEAVRLANRGAAVVGVVLNTVAAARETFEAIASSRGDRVLLTGRVRPYDRDKLLEEWLPRMRAGRERGDNDVRLFVVATQTVEVGADLDFDALVTEAASLDALRQRFGRLDRLGKLGTTRAVILKPKRMKERDWIYGEALEKTWEWMKEQGGSSIDFGVRRMGGLAPKDGSLSVDTGRGPLMFPAHVDAWAQTNPAPAADPEVAPFLHGDHALEAADVQIVWRADLEDVDLEHWEKILEAVPPTTTEALPLPIQAAKRWLAGSAVPVADLEGTAYQGDEGKGGERQFLIWRGPKKSEVGTGKGIRPGETIVVRASEGGCDRYGWHPDSREPVRDIGDLCANRRTEERGGRYRVRAHPMVLFPKDGEKREELTKLLARVRADEEGAVEELKELVRGVNEAAQDVNWNDAKDYGTGGGLLAESGWKASTHTVTSEADESDEDDRSSLTLEVSLKKHTAGVAQKAGRFARACGLTEPLCTAVTAAAERHDEGKADDRFQILLGNRKGEPLGKSKPCSPAEFRRRWRDAEYPKGARHEFYSVAAVEKSPMWPVGCDGDLALYLIGTHHGYGRPFPPVWIDDELPVAAVAGLEAGWADRYWKLIRKYGWWGLAYLETVLRRADCVRSREEEQEGATNESD